MLSEHDKKVYIEKTIRNDAKESLLDFTLYTKEDYKVNWHHELICDSIDDFLEDPDRKRLMIFVGPGRGKSELISRRLPAYYFGRNPTKRIIAASYGADLSQRMNRDVQRIIDDEEYRKVFPDTQLSGKNVKNTSLGTHVRTSDMFEIVNHRGYYRSAGIGQGITGMRFDLGIIDDPIKDAADAQSPRKKKMVYDWYDTTFITRAAPGAKVIMILTRWAEDDLAGRLLSDAEKNPASDQWEILCFPEIYDENHIWAHPDDQRENGDVLWPDFYPTEEVYARKASSQPKTWASMYQQLPSPDSGNIFHRDWFNYYTDLPEIEHRMLSVDCAFKETDSSDYVAMGVWGMLGANKYLLHYVKKRLDFPKTVEEILKIQAKFKGIRYTLVEDKANGSAVISTLKDTVPGMVPFHPKDSKIARANAVSQQVYAGNIYIPDPYHGKNRIQRPWCVEGTDEFVNELVAFPYGANDDSVDMMVQMLLNESDGASWVNEFIQGAANANAKPDGQAQLVDKLSNMMGWEIEEDY